MSGTQQLILLTLFIIRPVSSDQTDFIRDLTLNREPQNEMKLYPFFTLGFTLYSARISCFCTKSAFVLKVLLY